jgi:hypothetical protein
MDLRGKKVEGLDLIHLAQDMDQWRALMKLLVP